MSLQKSFRQGISLPCLNFVVTVLRLVPESYQTMDRTKCESPRVIGGFELLDFIKDARDALVIQSPVFREVALAFDWPLAPSFKAPKEENVRNFASVNPRSFADHSMFAMNKWLWPYDVSLLETS